MQLQRVRSQLPMTTVLTFCMGVVPIFRTDLYYCYIMLVVYWGVSNALAVAVLKWKEDNYKVLSFVYYILHRLCILLYCILYIVYFIIKLYIVILMYAY